MKIYKNIKEHPRKLDEREKRRAVVIGGTGATGRQVIKKLLDSNSWDKVTSIGRKPVLNGNSHSKLNDVLINSLNEMDSIVDEFSGHDHFFNCIGTTRQRAGSAMEFINIEYEISKLAALLASKSKIPHGSVISAGGANHNQWSHNSIHPLLYIKTMGLKEQTLIDSSFNMVSIFRPGMLIRQLGNSGIFEKFIESIGSGLKVEFLADAMIRDAMCKKNDSKEDPIIYLGNKCIKDSTCL